MIRIASIDNLSARAYRLSTPDFEHSLRFETPARVHALMAAGHCDAALLPVATLPGLGHAVESAGDFGIACTGPVRSVQLFSAARLANLLADRRPIYATPKSRTSVELFKLLCLRQYGTLPVLTNCYADGTAHLLIGDAAFECAQRNGASTNNLDLGGWWFAQTGLPFVYARWVVARALDPSRKARVLDWLESCAAIAATEAGQRALVYGLEMAPEDRLALQVYYQRLRARLSVSDVTGQSHFLQLMEGYANVHAAPVA
jgi:predicted solute-binding protein